MDNLDRIQEIMQCVGRLWAECPVQHGSVGDDLHTIADSIQIIKQELLESEPVRHGRWWNISGMNNTVFCSECLMSTPKELAMKYKGCPFCLAHMDGGIE